MRGDCRGCPVRNGDGGGTGCRGCMAEIVAVPGSCEGWSKVNSIAAVPVPAAVAAEASAVVATAAALALAAAAAAAAAAVGLQSPSVALALACLQEAGPCRRRRCGGTLRLGRRCHTPLLKAPAARRATTLETCFERRQRAQSYNTARTDVHVVHSEELVILPEGTALNRRLLLSKPMSRPGCDFRGC